MASGAYSLTELMTVAAAREIADGEIVFAGTGLPMLGTMLAQRTHVSTGSTQARRAAASSSRPARLPASSATCRCRWATRA
jgi:glutaconate CoA-transferase subunit B